MMRGELRDFPFVFDEYFGLQWHNRYLCKRIRALTQIKEIRRKRDKYARGWVHSVASVGMTITFNTAFSSRPRARDFPIASACIWATP